MFSKYELVYKGFSCLAFYGEMRLRILVKKKKIKTNFGMKMWSKSKNI